MCNITSGISKSCGYEVGGNSTNLYIGNAANITLTIGSQSTVTAISGTFYELRRTNTQLKEIDETVSLSPR